MAGRAIYEGKAVLGPGQWCLGPDFKGRRSLRQAVLAALRAFLTKGRAADDQELHYRPFDFLNLPRTRWPIWGKPSFYRAAPARI